MMKTYADALAWVLPWEGGFVHHPDDRGGPTNHGITQDTYRAWLLSLGLPPANVRDITSEEVAAIYRAWYWEASHCDRWTWPLSLVVFDSAVLRGPKNAVRMLQAAVGVASDGVVGPITRAAVADRDPVRVAEELCWARVAHHHARCVEDASQRVFLTGWIGRVLDLRDVVGA